MKYLVNSREMKQCDQHTIEHYGLLSPVLMERAALAAAEEIRRRFADKDSRILVVCGVGNNGGDGIAVARLLWLWGYDARICLPMDIGKMTPETKLQYEIAQNYQVPEVGAAEDFSCDVLVDALFGIGLSRGIEGPLAGLIARMNQARAFKLAVDISSGISADDGSVMGEAFRANLTVTFGFAKAGQLLYPGTEYSGELIVSDIGINEKSFLGSFPAGRYLTPEDIEACLPERSAYSNKGSYGRTLIVAGSPKMAGAAYLSAKAAYYSGCGLVRILTAEENREILLGRLPEAILTTYDAKRPDPSLLEECMQWADAMLIGPGLGTDDTAELLVKRALKQDNIPMVLDADALNLLAGDMELLSGSAGCKIVTPHLGEMGRMVQKSVPQLQRELVSSAGDFAREYGTVCVLKDARTVIASPEGHYYLNLTGNHGMATGGSGDVLAGLTAGLLAQKLSGETAASLACYIHGMAGDLAAGVRGARSMLAGDILEQLPNCLGRREA